MAKIKICGLFRGCDIDFVNEAVPDYIGFVFAESRRRVSAAEAAALRSRLKDGIAPVGVFVNAPPEDIRELYDSGVIELAQLHGTENAAYMQSLRRLCGIPVIKAVPVEKAGDILTWQDSPADYLLLDSGAGGTGRSFDWKLLGEARRPFFLAGGIGPENIERALSLDPYCVDVSSGAETDGKKDPGKILQLVRKTRSYGQKRI